MGAPDPPDVPRRAIVMDGNGRAKVAVVTGGSPDGLQVLDQRHRFPTASETDQTVPRSVLATNAQLVPRWLGCQPYCRPKRLIMLAKSAAHFCNYPALYPAPDPVPCMKGMPVAGGGMGRGRVPLQSSPRIENTRGWRQIRR